MGWDLWIAQYQLFVAGRQTRQQSVLSVRSIGQVHLTCGAACSANINVIFYHRKKKFFFLTLCLTVLKL